MKKKVALIFGITGQDGSYLAELLLKKKYIVNGVKRRSSSINTSRIDHIYQDPHEKKYTFRLHYGDITDSSSVSSIIKKVKPDEIYNLAAQSHVAVSFEVPEYTANADALGALRILEAIKFHNLEKKTKFYQAGTSEMYGKVQTTPQDEKTSFYPLSPYGVAKLYAYWICVNYREAYGIFACNGILFNHESPNRGETFVSRKITRATSRIALGLQETLYLGNMYAKRDWGHARDYVEAMYLILQQSEPDDFVIATGVTTEVREFVRKCFNHVGIELEFKGSGVEEIAVIKKCSNSEYQIEEGKVVLRVDPKYFRPTEVDLLLGNPEKANRKLNWKPKHDLDSLIEDMMKSDLELFKKDKYLKDGGHKVLNYHE